MRSYKNLSFLIVLPLVLALNTGCRKYIENQPVSELGVPEAYSSVDNAYKSLIGIYDELQGDNGYGIRVSLYYPFDSDEGIVTGGIDLGRRDIGRYRSLTTNTELRNPFVQFYRGIERANLAIDQIPTSAKYSSGTATEQKELRRMYGEALTLRAQFYHELIRNWGDVPAPMIPSYKQTADLFLVRANRDSTYDKLLADLALAKTLVPWRTEVARNERITKGAVMGLRARIALYRGGFSLRGTGPAVGRMERGSNHLQYYQIAKDECAELMQRRDQHTLNPDFENVWRNVTSLTYDPFGEILFEVGAGGGNANSDSRHGNYSGTRVDGASRYGPGNAGITALPTYFYAFDSVDTRRTPTIGLYRILATNLKQHEPITTITFGKYRRDWRLPLLPGSTVLNTGMNWSIIRFSDVLLMFAEAENELNGPTGPARAALEEVRKRAFRGNEGRIGVIPSDKASFFNAIVNERLLEFGGEGIRKYDLIRWNLLNAKMAPQTGEVRVELRQLATAQGKYANVPRYIYWRNVGEEVQLVNSYYSSDAYITATPTGTTRTNWREDLQRGLPGYTGTLAANTIDVGTTTAPHYIDAIGFHFQTGRSELFPFDLATMQSYQGKLEQNPGYQ
jgi:hypothetical protein